MPPRLQTGKISFNGGLDLRSTTQELQSLPGVATQLTNFEQDVGGGYRRINGYTPVGSGTIPGTGKILGVHIYESGIVACRGNGVYHTFDGVTWLQVNKDVNTLSNFTTFDAAAELPRANATTYTFDEFTQGAAAGRVDLLIHDGSNKPAVLTVLGTNHSGAQYRYVEIAAINQGAYGIVHDDQHVVAGDSSAPSTFYVSAIADMEDFSGSLSGAYSVADPIVGIASFREILYVFCENSIWSAQALNTATPQIEPVTRNVGCVDGATIQEIGGDLVFLATDGIRTLGATARIGDISLTAISEPINSLVRDILQNRNRYTFSSTTIREKNQYRLFYLDEAQPVRFSRGIIATYFPDPNRQYAWSFSEIDGMEVTTVHSDTLRGQETLVHGDLSGGVHYQDQGNSFNGTAIRWVYETPYFDMGDVGLRKNIHDIDFYVQQEGTVSADIQLRFDNMAEDVEQPVAQRFQQRNAPAIWGEAIWGNAIWGARDIAIDTFYTEGSFFTLAVRIFDTTNSISAPFTIQGFDMNFTPSGRI